MRKSEIKAKRENLSTREGIEWWERQCGFTSLRAAKELNTPLRTYARWKASGLPRGFASSMIQREVILNRMEELLKKYQCGRRG